MPKCADSYPASERWVLLKKQSGNALPSDRPKEPKPLRTLVVAIPDNPLLLVDNRDPNCEVLT